MSRLSGQHKNEQRIHWYATLLHPDNTTTLSTLIYQPQRKTNTTLNIIALDTSGSTIAGEQLSDAKAAVLSLCEHFYQKRQRITLLCFGNQRCDWLVVNSSVPANIKGILAEIQAGGGTPLRQALLAVDRYITKRKQANSNEKQRLFLLTDGRSRHDINDIHFDKMLDITVLDSEKSSVRLNKAHDLAQRLNAKYSRLFDES
ncbi:MAG: VWA domain-containing protein [Cocleimonas sp.]|nr:VWA domain-containing protein [Cocleimonas sp.]